MKAIKLNLLINGSLSIKIQENFGHIAYRVENIYETYTHLQELGIEVNRSPRDGQMAFIRSADNIFVELLQAGELLPKTETWASTPNNESW